MTPARKAVNKAVTEFSTFTKDEVLFVGVHPKLDGYYRGMFDQMVTMDVLPDTTPAPDIVGDIQSCPQIPDNTFKGVIMIGVYEFLSQPDQAFWEINRILKPEGMALLCLPGEAYYSNRPTIIPEGIFGEIKPLLCREIEIIYYRTPTPYYFNIWATKT